MGTLVGDALGMPWEGWTAQGTRAHAGDVRDLVDRRLGAGTYTDDTQMTAAVAEALLEAPDPRRIEVEVIAQAFARRFDPARGYGTNTRRILSRLRAGQDWRMVLDDLRLPGGSYANGAAMRVAPVALAAFPSLSDVVSLAELQARATGHDHPEARFGARLQAVGIHVGLQSGRSSPAPRALHLLRLASDGWDDEPPASFLRRAEWIDDHQTTDPDAARTTLGTGLHAAESVSAALWAFLAHPDDPEEALVKAVGLGGDTDTVGAMAGALAGARNGASRLPERWLRGVEPGGEGRDRLVELADALYERVEPFPAAPSCSEPL